MRSTVTQSPHGGQRRPGFLIANKLSKQPSPFKYITSYSTIRLMIQIHGPPDAMWGGFARADPEADQGGCRCRKADYQASMYSVQVGIIIISLSSSPTACRANGLFGGFENDQVCTQPPGGGGIYLVDNTARQMTFTALFPRSTAGGGKHLRKVGRHESIFHH